MAFDPKQEHTPHPKRRNRRREAVPSLVSVWTGTAFEKTLTTTAGTAGTFQQQTFSNMSPMWQGMPTLWIRVLAPVFSVFQASFCMPTPQAGWCENEHTGSVSNTLELIPLAGGVARQVYVLTVNRYGGLAFCPLVRWCDKRKKWTILLVDCPSTQSGAALGVLPSHLKRFMFEWPHDFSNATVASSTQEDPTKWHCPLAQTTQVEQMQGALDTKNSAVQQHPFDGPESKAAPLQARAEIANEGESGLSNAKIPTNDAADTTQSREGRPATSEHESMYGTVSSLTNNMEVNPDAEHPHTGTKSAVWGGHTLFLTKDQTQSATDDVVQVDLEQHSALACVAHVLNDATS